MQSESAEAMALVTVWDWALRVFHWALVLLFVVAYLSGVTPGYYGLHKAAGYGILGLLIFRFIWGFAGPKPSRFAGFIKGPAAALAHLRELLRRKHRPMPGHNPLGGWAVVAILGLLLLQAISGLFASTFDYEGPLSGLLSDAGQDWMARIHAFAIDPLLALLAVHLLGIAATSILGGENLVASMIHGRKRLAAADAVGIESVSWWRAPLAIALAALAVWLLLSVPRAAG